ncbi:hypothetical protein KI688_006859 [Linnemannia hyalina]|uniref:Protein kinase domain-containing protein n=1 Tax=Linnemannia hyalina TaxID=64524 RepID=A0A9P7XHV2_9FUNG|nr:hypothetical protein KI688_006859 [Linnemannia hyalina]
MHVVTKQSPRTKNAPAPSDGEAESDTSAPTINTSSEQDGPVWRDPLENPSFITTSPTTTMSQDDLYSNSFSMVLQSSLPLTDRRSFASQLEASLLASNLTAATTTLNSVASFSLSSQYLRSTIGNNDVTTTSTTESDSKEDSKGDLHSEETMITASAVKEFSKAKLRKKDRQNLFRLGHRGRGPGRRGPTVQAEQERSPLDLIRGEIAILKKLNHINIVKLYEVLDVAAEDSMYMVFELCELGALTEVTVGDKLGKIFTDSECRDVFQQMVLGIEYLHEHDIVHRDIKPDNLLRSADGTLKIVDFGVSEMFTKKGDDTIKKSAGSPAFMAPELCRSHGEVSGKPTDLWSMGITLFCIRYGRLPFKSGTSLELQKMINENEPDLGDEQDPRFRTTITKLLEKDPSKRITLDELRNDPWLTDDGLVPLISKDENTQNAVLEVTEDDLRGAVQQLNGLFRVLKAVYKFKQLRKSPSSRASSRDRREMAAEEPSDRSLSPPLIDSPPSEPVNDIFKPVEKISDSLLAKIDALIVQGDSEMENDD